MVLYSRVRDGLVKLDVDRDYWAMQLRYPDRVSSGRHRQLKEKPNNRARMKILAMFVTRLKNKTLGPPHTEMSNVWSPPSQVLEWRHKPLKGHGGHYKLNLHCVIVRCRPELNIASRMM
jgi:hypothetical protein